ncbi:MAG: hypothetical protein GAK28_01201 [Luteibacter sp.]|uniref:DUF2884 family protein n=1 Tax=Luteibacter sp. TaxID=1886636 RepID=UPI00137DAFA5|nr:DUF2884 family protein [Luteibacter sp.]KAF1008222.1 MAG: hypothetical protein GAK28_01201 [Luteibacter sp.]
MRHPFIAAALVVALAATPLALPAKGFSFSTDSCKHDYSTPYDVDVTQAGLSFHRTDGTPSRVFLHDGALQVDGRAVAVSTTDADALRRYEAGVRRLMPLVASVARDAIEVGYSAMTTVTMTFAEPDQRSRMLEKIRRKQAEALRSVDEGVGAGHWSSDRMIETAAGSVSDSVGELVGSVTSSAVTAALSGDTAKVAALQARATSLSKALDTEMDKRSKALDQRANAICPQVNELSDIQQGWHIRLPDGSPLQLMTIKPKNSDKDADEDASKKVAQS